MSIADRLESHCPAALFSQGFPVLSFALLRVDGFAWTEAVLSRRCSHTHGDLPEGSQEGKRPRQVNDHPAHRGHHPRTEFQEPLPKCPYLGASAIGQRGLQAQLLHEHVGRGGQQHTELIGQKQLQLVRSISSACSSLMLAEDI